MKKIEIAQTTQLLSNFAVIVGIVFLAIEVREAGNAARQQTETARVEGYNALNLTLASNPDLSRIFVIGLDDPGRLTNTEAAQFSNFMRAVINQQRQMHEHFLLGLISEENWQYAAQQAAQMYSTAGGKKFLETNGYGSLAFIGAIEGYMGQELQSSFSLGRAAQDF